MFEHHLFLAYPVNSEFDSKLQSVAEGLRSLFIQNNHPDYLHRFNHEGQAYLGKNLGSIVDFHGLESAGANLMSLLKRLVPDVSYHHHELFILAIPV